MVLNLTFVVTVERVCMDLIECKNFLDERVERYNSTRFIQTDPIQIPHRFHRKEDIEIAGFLTATIAWGNRNMIIRSAEKMMKFLGDSPYEFIMEHTDRDVKRLQNFVHRTFQSTDLAYFIHALSCIYKKHGGLEKIFTEHALPDTTQDAITAFRTLFFSFHPENRTRKHVSDPSNNSAAKRINMFLRWMVRRDAKGVDFGLWRGISPSALSCPLDVHSGNVARKLGLLKRKQNDGKALKELDTQLRLMDASDPVKYDFALFGLGVFEGF
jgi:uncharacterized protein (TIGR02757 family)